ncbi:MAG: CoA transferase [Chromatiales bacterium]|nr:CoA transferase [Chromatiales bacterium]
MPGSLDGILVLDLSQGPSAALTAMMLADHGARVVRLVSTPDAALREGGFVVWDRSKECVLVAAADLAGGGGQCAEWVRHADVLVEDFPPSARPDWLAHSELATLNGRLVSCSITAYGHCGPHRDEPANDDLVLARTGVLDSMPGFRSGPIHTVHPLPSTGAGIMGALGIAGALLAREQTGRGRAVETSLMAGALLYHPKVLGEKLAPHVFQTHPSGSAPFYSVYECSDGNWVQLGCVHPGFIAKAAKLMSMETVLSDPIYGKGQMPQTKHAEFELRDMLKRVLATRPYAEWEALFESNDIPFAQARLTDEGLDDPQIRHNEMVVALDDPGVGSVDQMGVPVKLRGTPGRVHGPRQRATSTPPPAGEPTPATPASDAPDPLPLAGIRVLEITNLIAGPMAARLLADMGADVIKLEPLTGDISRPIARTYFYSVNFEKRSASIDTSNDRGKALVQSIAATVDVVLANLRPGATARMGISTELNPRLVETHITGYGFTGPYSRRPGIDPLAQALMGLQRAQGGAGNPPSFPAQLAPTDFTTGAMGAFGTVLALFARERGAGPQQVEVNLLDGGVMLSSEWFTRYNGRPVRALADGGQHGHNPMHRLYQLQDGWVYVTADDAASRAAFAEVVGVPDPGLPEMYTPTGAHPNDTDVGAQFSASLASRTLADVVEGLRAAGVPHSPVMGGDSRVFFSDPHAQENGKTVTRNHPNAGQLTVAWKYIGFGGSTDPNGRPTPLLGEHNGDVLSEAGLSETQIAALDAEGLIKTELPVS